MGATRKIDAANLLAETIILRHAEAKGIDIPDRIWQPRFSKSEWKYWYGIYNGEYTKACRLLKNNNLRDLLDALETDEGKVILSLHNDKIKRLVGEVRHRRELIEKEQKENKVEASSPDTLPRKKQGKKSKLGKLR